MGTRKMGSGEGGRESGPQGFRNLKAWQVADDLAAAVFRLTEESLDARHRWLGLQVVRASFSVTSNIAEGYGRGSLPDYARFLELAGASLNEVENAIHFMRRNRVVDPKVVTEVEEMRKLASNLLFGLLRSLRQKIRDKGDWQRGMVKEEPPQYAAEASELESKFQVPSSKFLAAIEDGLESSEQAFDRGAS